MKRAVSSLIAVLAGCAAAATTNPTVAPNPPIADAPIASVETPIAAASASAPIAASSASVSATPTHPLVIEAVYRPGRYPYPESDSDKRAAITEIAHWNDGGRAAKWHAQPRVVISEPVAKGWDTKGAMRMLRASRYGGVRRCFDAALREHPDLEGRTVVRINVRGSTITSAAATGTKVPDARKHGHAMPDKSVASCIAASFSGATVPAAKKKLTALVSVDVWPGDAKMPASDGDPGNGTIDLDATRAAVLATMPTIRPCFDAAESRNPGLWGRLALRVAIDGDVTEVESTFPDDDASACAAAALAHAALPAATGTARIVVALRYGAPP